MGNDNNANQFPPPSLAAVDWIVIFVVGAIAFALEGDFFLSAAEQLRSADALPSGMRTAAVAQVTTLLLAKAALLTAVTGLIGALAGIWREALGKGLAVIAALLAVVGAGLTLFLAA